MGRAAPLALVGIVGALGLGGPFTPATLQRAELTFTERAVTAPKGLVVRVGTASVLRVEQKLQGRGFRVGRVDGRMDALTRRGLAIYQEKRGLHPTGRINLQTLLSLGVLSEVMENDDSWKDPQSPPPLFL
ncbi:peptidoglycan-binding domain-containing protein [Thiohalorhabdus sp. Cl-TMA]|uniref:Peptidoglycan-binding protein n=1 Tax=Thiohalorhabdus methylotrophus TaxID=3242694 RepID=A0ABV4U0X8_9GAMM